MGIARHPSADVTSINHLDLAESIESPSHISLACIMRHPIHIDRIRYCKGKARESVMRMTESAHLFLLWLE